MSNVRRVIAIVTLVVATGCMGSEAGNPKTAPLCDSFMFGLVEGEFEVPQNATAIPLQFWENVRADATASFELEVSLNGQPFSSHHLTDHEGDALEVGGPLSGVVMFVSSQTLPVGGTLRLTRQFRCQNAQGEAFDTREEPTLQNTVVMHIGPAQALPTSPGELRTIDRTGAVDVVLTLSDELWGWRHLITEQQLRVGGERLFAHGLLAGDDRTFEWSLLSGDCRPCPSEPVSNSDAPPLACHAHLWEPGEVELGAEISLAGASKKISSESLTKVFETTHCSQQSYSSRDSSGTIELHE